jgi:hypothetical protein
VAEDRWLALQQQYNIGRRGQQASCSITAANIKLATNSISSLSAASVAFVSLSVHGNDVAGTETAVKNLSSTGKQPPSFIFKKPGEFVFSVPPNWPLLQ